MVLLTFYKMYQTPGMSLPSFHAAYFVLTVGAAAERKHRSPLVHTMYRDGMSHICVCRAVRELIPALQDPFTTSSSYCSRSQICVSCSSRPYVSSHLHVPSPYLTRTQKAASSVIQMSVLPLTFSVLTL